MDFVDGLAPGGATCLLLASGAYGMLRADDAERLQVGAFHSGAFCLGPFCFLDPAN